MQFEFPTHHLQNIKLGLHVAQGLLILVSWCLTIAVFSSSANIDARPGWSFGLCFLSLPALIFLTMTMRFPRTRKFANPYALAAVDGLFMLLWLSAFASVASWNSAGKCKSGCKLSEAVVGLGVFTWLLFTLTFILSIYSVLYYKREGYLPGLSRAPTNTDTIDPDKEAFSTAPHADEYAPIGANVHEDHEGHDHGHSGSYSGEPLRMQLPESRYDSSGYGGEYGGNQVYAPPREDEDTGYAGAYGAGRAQFPQGNYNNV